MQLLRLMGSYPDVLEWVGGSVEIAGITPSLQRVRTGYLFVALSGAGEDRHDQIHQALLEGAVAVLGEWDPEDLAENLPWGTFTYMRVLDVTSAWFWLCKNWGWLCKLGMEPTQLVTRPPLVADGMAGS
jgi:UDP-N-acetylmuramyl pentapeptide synthase